MDIIYWRINTDETAPINMNKAVDTESFLNGVRVLGILASLYFDTFMFLLCLYRHATQPQSQDLLYRLSKPWTLCEKCSSWPECVSADPR